MEPAIDGLCKALADRALNNPGFFVATAPQKNKTDFLIMFLPGHLALTCRGSLQTEFYEIN